MYQIVTWAALYFTVGAVAGWVEIWASRRKAQTGEPSVLSDNQVMAAWLFFWPVIPVLAGLAWLFKPGARPKWTRNKNQKKTG